MERRIFITALVGSLLVAPIAAEAQGLVYYTGRVQWLAGLTLIVMTDEGWSIRVDLRWVDQSSYLGLRTGTRLVVTGVISNDGDFLIGRSIQQIRSDDQSP